MQKTVRATTRRSGWLLMVCTLALTSLVQLPLAPPAGGGPSGSAPAISAVPSAIHSSDFLGRREIRQRLDLSRRLSTYYLAPTNQQPIPDPDCATGGRPEATSAVVHPAARTRTQYFEYDVPGRAWSLVGRVLVLEYPSRGQARAAFARAVSSVRGARGYTLTCEAINPIVSDQRPEASPDVVGRSFAWRYHLRAAHAGSWRDVISTSGRRLVWVELGRQLHADLDWSRTPPAQFPRHPSRPFLAELAEGAIAKGL